MWVFRVLYSYLKPESVRVHPDATVRPWATVQVQGDALSFASALGYVYVTLPSPPPYSIPTCLTYADNYDPGTLPDADLNYIKEVMSFVKDLS